MYLSYKWAMCLFFVKVLSCYRLPLMSSGAQLGPQRCFRMKDALNSLTGKNENYYYCGENRVALVTGAGRGIGRSIAKTLAKSVSHVLCVSKTQKSCDSVVDELTAQGYKSTGYAADVSNREEITQLITKLLNDYNRIDILVNNAGITRDNLFLRMKEEEWEDVIRTNLNSMFYVTQSISKRMINNKYGRIINVSSTVGLTGNMGQTNYSASKAGVIGFTKTLSKELASRNITVNAIAPGFIESDMTHSIGDNIKQNIISYIPARRMGTPEEVANLVGYLSSEIAGYINGKVFVIDGGLAS
ncbi:3-oxoacyl-[acyl-carrier-protein] reductase, putative (FabG) [Plasmodium ovale wallikeri]|uniref:3-oxoacyl-[acyl-carrier-protein] reductase n=1 Tax=Plasmodium ovale wallikeri TaxID=864142 RepID=A0A1A8YR27_PLAOA|nr:3-oxoacyl-[acyl-carrier-protein] reductase, putative (FabG) [Plasmodium ovale wallikeri]SBT34017.1 3-oxoacyl-[acyl-carrier-protein] reductase, putative (FabG) [Plasmodium ovale wallikeri]